MCWCQWSISAIVMWNHLLPFYELWVINCIKNIQLAMAIPQAEPLTNEENAAILGGVGGVWVKQNKMPSASMWLCAKCEGPPLLSTQLAGIWRVLVVQWSKAALCSSWRSRLAASAQNWPVGEPCSSANPAATSAARQPGQGGTTSIWFSAQ